MGQKVNPVSLRLPIKKDWQSKWFAKGDYARWLVTDLKLRRAIERKLAKRSGVARVEIERSGDSLTIAIHTSKPGVVIGRGGSGIEELKKILQRTAGQQVAVNIEEVKKPELVAILVAENLAIQLERRISFRRAIKMAVENSLKAGAKGVKIIVAGRLGGSEMARRESVSRGSIPLHTLRADIDYAQTIARTTYGVIGVKVWVYRGETTSHKDSK